MGRITETSRHDGFVPFSSRLQRAVQTRIRDLDEERGATLAVIGLTLILILLSGAIAVDLSALERQGQTLQNSADAAALAGASVWSQTQDTAQATQVVADVIVQNGIVIGSEMQLDVSFPGPAEVRVELVDSDPEILLAGVVGIGNDLTRNATARHFVCEDGCFRSLDVNPPPGPIAAAGSGDGFVPIPVGNRIYAVNHHGSTIECVDRSTSGICWPARQLFSTPVLTTNLSHAGLVGDRIYYVGWNGPGSSLPTGDGYLQLGCFNTSTDTRCANQVDLFNVGHGVLHTTPDALYVFAANRNVYCFEPVTFTECADYLGGRNTALTAEPGWGNWNENSAWTADQLGHDGKIYVTLSNRGAVSMHCWDTATHAPCSSFAPQLLNGSRSGTNDDYVNGRLFLFRDTSGTATAICSQGSTMVVDCFDLETAAPDTGAEGAMTATLSAVAIDGGALVGVSTYHPGTNRQFFVSSYTSSWTYCHDFTASAPCGDVQNLIAPFGLAETYGYTADGDCMIGLGDNSIFFTLKPDLSGPCDAANATIDITACTCSGTNVWPPVSIGDDEGVEGFEMRVLDPSGTPVFPADGTWLALDADTAVDLTSIDGAYPYLTLEVRLTVIDGEDPWADGVAPNLLVGMGNDDPLLVE